MGRRISRYENILSKTQRKMLLRVACAYKTMSGPALQVITETPPITLLIEKRKTLESMAADDRNKNRSRVRDAILNRWQETWDGTTDVASWTKELIKRLTYELTQFLTGHGSYRNYTKRIGKETVSSCIYCGDESEDNPEHTLMFCPRWADSRSTLLVTTGRVVNSAELLEKMIACETLWKAGEDFIKCTMKSKECEERARQRGAN